MNKTRDIMVRVDGCIGPMGRRGRPGPVSAGWAGLTGLVSFVQIGRGKDRMSGLEVRCQLRFVQEEK